MIAPYSLKIVRQVITNTISLYDLAVTSQVGMLCGITHRKVRFLLAEQRAYINLSKAICILFAKNRCQN